MLRSETIAVAAVVVAGPVEVVVARVAAVAAKVVVVKAVGEDLVAEARESHSSVNFFN